MRNIFKALIITVLVFSAFISYSQTIDTTTIEKLPSHCGHIATYLAHSGCLETGGTIRGHVYNNYLPVKHTLVRIYCYSSKQLVDSTFTNKKGEYRFNNLFGDFSMTVEYKKGYFKKTKVENGQTTIVDF